MILRGYVKFAQCSNTIVKPQLMNNIADYDVCMFFVALCIILLMYTFNQALVCVTFVLHCFYIYTVDLTFDTFKITSKYYFEVKHITIFSNIIKGIKFCTNDSSLL